MDDEAAEIELLEQNLKKTRQISQRMISILSTFDTRLVSVERSILPLYNATQALTRRQDNIESTLQRIEDVASNNEDTSVEEALILRGPQAQQLQVYIDALERLNASIAFKANAEDSKDTARLVEAGAKRLSQLYTKLVAEGSSGAQPGVFEYQTAQFPPELLATLQPLVTFLRTLPLPATHPSHPAAAGILSTLRDAQRGYSDMRGAWSRKGLEAQGRRLVERLDKSEGLTSGSEVGDWVVDILNVAETEYNLLLDLTPLPSAALLAQTFANLISPLLEIFNSTLSTLNSRIKRNLNRYTFLALSTHSALSAHQARWDDLMMRRAGRKENDLKDSLHSIRATCLRSFPELLADIKAGTLPTGAEVNTSTAAITVSTVQFLEQIPDVQDAVSSALLTLGDGNWRMGDGSQVGKSGRPGEGNDRVVLEHYLYDVVTTLVNGLTTLARAQRRPAYGSIFLLNNMSFLQTRLLLEPRAPVMSLLAKPTVDMLNSSFRTAKAGYFDSNFSPLMQALTEDGRDKGGKAAAKEKFTRFFDLLEEVTDRHRIARVMTDDDHGREILKEEAVKLVVPSLERFTRKNLERDFSKNPQKYIKMSAEEVEIQIRNLYS